MLGSSLVIPSLTSLINSPIENITTIKRNACESVLMRWMDLDPVIQSEANQKDKHCILTHVYGI